MGRHALLSASSSHRWLACPPSARLCENYEDTGSEYAQKGTDAHSLCEHKLVLCQKKVQVKRELHLNILNYTVSISSFLNSFQETMKKSL